MNVKRFFANLDINGVLKWATKNWLEAAMQFRDYVDEGDPQIIVLLATGLEEDDALEDDEFVDALIAYGDKHRDVITRHMEALEAEHAEELKDYL